MYCKRIPVFIYPFAYLSHLSFPTEYSSTDEEPWQFDFLVLTGWYDASHTSCHGLYHGGTGGTLPDADLFIELCVFSTWIDYFTEFE